MKTPTHLIVHNTASMAQGPDGNPDQWKATNNYHKHKVWGYNKDGSEIRTSISSLGYYGGYNYEMNTEGDIHQFRQDGEFTVATWQQNMNDGRAIHMALDGRFDIELPTLKQCKDLYAWLLMKMEQYGIPRENVGPHRKYAPKTCWGSKLPDDVLGYLEKRLGLAGVPEWAELSVEKAKKKGITEWDDPWEEITPQTIEWILHDLGLRDELKGTISKVEFIHALDKGGLLD